MRQTTILGAPGCGKTHTLIERLTDLIAGGTRPDDICFSAFTRVAADTATQRTIAQIGGRQDDYAWFGTIHSLCGRLLDFDWRHRLLSDSDRNGIGRTLLREFGKRYGFVFEWNDFADFDAEADAWTSQNAEGNQLLAWWALVRQMQIDLETATTTWRSPSAALTPARMRLFAEAYESYKDEIRRQDFTDVLMEANRLKVCPPTSVLILDEAQDLGPLEWSVIDNWRRKAQIVYLGGDDPQAIYGWKGADAALFLERMQDGSIETLEQSYRLPRQLWALSEWLLGHIKERYEKTFLPQTREGAILERPLFRVPFEESGSWFVLARNAFLLASMRRHLEENAIPYQSRRGFDPKSAYYDAAQAVTALAHGRFTDPVGLRALVRRLRKGEDYDLSLDARLRPGRDGGIPPRIFAADLTGLGFSERWIERLSFERIPVRLLNLTGRNYTYLARLQQKYGDDIWLREPAITLSTIHGVKGDEADHVVLLTDMAPASQYTLDTDPDAEHRVFYVGVTRARERLYLVPPQTDISYPLLANGWWQEAFEQSDAAVG